MTTPGTKIISRYFIAAARKVFGFFSSLKTAIPLLVITIVVTIVGTLFPQPDLFKTWWYLSLLGLNGVSLLFITILHIPMILVKKGRNALIGVVVTHLGILILIVGAIYGGMSGFRYEIKAIEGETTIVPGLPFAINLEKLVIEEYPEGTFAEESAQSSLKKRQDSHISLLKSGNNWANFVIRPGSPAKIDGVIILPSLNDIGWYFELIVTNPLGRQKTIPVRPWAPPVFTVGDKPIMVHSLMDSGTLSAQVFTMVDEQVMPMGVIGHEQELVLDQHSIALGSVKRYTGMAIYNRPHEPILIIGCLAMLFGLVWHFYFRHRDRSKKIKE
jgi:cytochrome c biogenesis protein ResB